MKRWWEQFRWNGIPRCQESFDAGSCRRLIWPWQPIVCDYDSWPVHHSCWHRRTVEMLAFVTAEETEPDATPGYHCDFYDACKFCKRTTQSSFRQESTA